MKNNEILNDLIYSKKYLEDFLGKEIISFSVPFNLYSPLYFNLINKAGYKKIFFNSFYKSNYYNSQYNIIQRKQIFSFTSIKTINKYLTKENYNVPLSDKLIQFCSNATVGLKRLL